MDSVRAIRGSAMSAGPATDGMTRKMAEVEEGVAVLQGHFEPQTTSGWHHHGERTVCVYVVNGRARVEWGPGGRESVDLASGDFYVISPNTVHRETNPAATDQAIAAFAMGSGPYVVNVEGPEPEA